MITKESGPHAPKPGAGGQGAAFSVVELLVVLTIIVVLMALIVPVVRSTRAKAGDVGCMSNLRQIGAALSLYAGDHDGRLPGPSWAAVIASTDEVSEGSGIFVSQLAPYAPNSDKLWDCPLRPELRQKGFTGYAQGNVQGNMVFGYPSPVYEPLKIIQIVTIEPDPDKRWLLADLDFWNVPNSVYDDIAPFPAHRGGRNVLYVDGHVKWVRSKQNVSP